VDWPQFRGIRAAGIAEGFPVAETWDVASGRGVRWTTAIPGLGLASPIVWGDLVCLSTSISRQRDAALKVGLYGDVESVSDDTEHEWRTYCLDRKSGAVRWQQTVLRAVPKIKRHPKSSHANSTLATDGERLIAFFGSEGLYAYDLTGKPLWKKDLGVLDAGFFMDPTAQWETAS
jgi:outer membrane protein assembly factor BamB